MAVAVRVGGHAHARCRVHEKSSRLLAEMASWRRSEGRLGDAIPVRASLHEMVGQKSAWEGSLSRVGCVSARIPFLHEAPSCHLVDRGIGALEARR